MQISSFMWGRAMALHASKVELRSPRLDKGMFYINLNLFNVY